MKSEKIEVSRGWNRGRRAAATLGLVRQAGVWHLQGQHVGVVFDDALNEDIDPERILGETRRKNLELARENASLTAEKTALGRENEEQSEEIGQLMDVASASREELAKVQAKLASVEVELAEFRRATAETTLKRAELEPFLALATPEARLLLVTTTLKGPVDVGELVYEADNNTEVLEAICRLRTVGFIKFQRHNICITVSGEAFAKRLGFVR